MTQRGDRAAAHSHPAENARALASGLRLLGLLRETTTTEF